MNVTENENKDRKQDKESCLQRDIAERKEYAEASAHLRITENNHTNTDFQTDNLLEKILQRENLNEAYEQVERNKGAGGIDGMQITDMCMWWIWT